MIEEIIDPGSLDAEAAGTWQILLVALQRCEPGQPAMGPLVIDLLQPGPEAGVEVVDTANGP